MAFSLKQTVISELRRRRTRSLVDKNSLWASQASVVTKTGDKLGKCLRASFWEKTGEEPTNPVDDGVVAMGYMGTKIEDGVIDLLKNQGIWENNNVKWQAHGVSGEVDVLIRVLNKDVTPPQEELYIVECKSCSGYYINKEVYGYYAGAGSNRTYVPGKPKDQHLLQSALYAYVGKDRGFKGTIIFYISRDESKFCEHFVQIGDDGEVIVNGIIDHRFNIKDVIDRYEILRKAIDSNELPDRDYRPEYSDEEVTALFDIKDISKTANDNHKNRKELYCDSECKYCDFKLKCLDQKAMVTSKLTSKKKVEDPFDVVMAKPVKAEKPAYIAFGSM
jgi:hypothetical protein